jgi:hypothetical protein
MIKPVYNIVNIHNIKGQAGLLLACHAVQAREAQVIAGKHMPGESPDRMMYAIIQVLKARPALGKSIITGLICHITPEQNFFWGFAQKNGKTERGMKYLSKSYSSISI